MSGVAIVRYLLANNAAVLALVPAARIKPDLKVGTVLPAIEVAVISSRPEFLGVDGYSANILWTERIQVSPLVKDSAATPAGAGYAGVDTIIMAILAAVSQTRGFVNGIYCDSIVPDQGGPDLYDDVAGIHSKSQDFMVKWVSPNGPPALASVVSRKQHANGIFDIPLDVSQAISASITVEPRSNVGGHQIVFVFDRLITSVGAITCLDSTSAAFGAAVMSFGGNSVIVNISGAPDVKRARITVAGINGTVAAAINVGFLIGDVNNSRNVSTTDLTAITARNGQEVLASDINRIRCDINLSGVIEGGVGSGETDRDMAAVNSPVSI